MNQEIIDFIVKDFQESPIRITHSFDRLTKKYSATIDEVREAKNQFKESLLTTTDTIDIPEGMIVERVWINNKGKKSVQMRPDAMVGINTQFFTDLIKNFSKPKASTYIPSSTDKVLLVYTSDKHLGAEVPDNSLFENKYDAAEFEKRMMKLSKEVIMLDNLHKFSKIIIADLGDAIDGMDGFTGSGKHKLPQNMSNREVYNTFVKVHLQFFTDLLHHCTCDNFELRTVGESNHGGDMEWMLFKTLEAILNEKFPQIETYVANKFIEHFELGDHTFIFCHGKDWKDMKFPLARNVDAKTESYIKSYIDAKGIRSKFIHFIKGDSHACNSEYTQFFRYKNVMSMFGSSKWVQTNFMSNTKGVSLDILDLSTNTVTEHYMFL